MKKTIAALLLLISSNCYSEGPNAPVWNEFNKLDLQARVENLEAQIERQQIVILKMAEYIDHHEGVIDNHANLIDAHTAILKEMFK